MDLLGMTRLYAAEYEAISVIARRAHFARRGNPFDKLRATLNASREFNK